MKSGKQRASLRASVGFADINPGDGDARLGKTFEHALFRATGKPVERGRVPNPGLGFLPYAFGREDDKRDAVFDKERFARERKLFLGRGALKMGSVQEGCRYEKRQQRTEEPGAYHGG